MKFIYIYIILNSIIILIILLFIEIIKIIY